MTSIANVSDIFKDQEHHEQATSELTNRNWPLVSEMQRAFFADGNIQTCSES